jgi:hypothetical protein
MSESTNILSIAEYFTAETYTPYAVAKVVNQILADLETGKVLPPQMFYTYAKKGMIGGCPKEAKSVTRDQAVQWTEKYVTKHFGA